MGQGTQTADLLGSYDLASDEDIGKTVFGEHFRLADGGHAYAVHTAPGRQLFMCDNGASVGLDVGAYLRFTLAEEGVQGLDILLQDGQIHHQGRGIEFLTCCAHGFEDGAFHARLPEITIDWQDIGARAFAWRMAYRLLEVP